MTLEKRSAILIIGCISIVVLVVMGSASFGDEAREHDQALSQTLEVQPVEGQAPERNEGQNIPSTSLFDSERLTSSFMTDVQEAHVLWADGERVIYVQDNQIYYSANGVSKRSLHTWDETYAAQAWLNETYLLVGTQLAEHVPNLESYQTIGSWFAIEIGTTPTVINRYETFYGPDQVLTVTFVPEPNLFFFTIQNDNGYSEHIFHSSHARWSSLNINPNNLNDSYNVPIRDDTPRYFANAHTFQFENRPVLHVFSDDKGTVTYYDDQHHFNIFNYYRYFEYEIVDATLLAFLNDSPKYLVRFKHKSEGDVMQVLGQYIDEMLPFNELLWEDGWQALDARSFTRVSPYKLEVIQYDEADGANALDKNAKHTVFDVSEGSLLSSQGTLLEYDFAGELRFVSWYDLINSEIKRPEAIWALPLQHVVTEEVERPPHDFGHIESQRVVVPSPLFIEDNTNAPVPDELWGAIWEVYPGGDYGPARTYRLIDSSWFVLNDQQFYKFDVDNEELIHLGEMPIKRAYSIGEAVSGLGVMDFVQVNDHWFVTDTEASRVIKLDHDLNIVAEVAVPYPYEITVDEELLHIASIAQQWTVDLDLNVLTTTLQPFITTEQLEEVDYPYFHPHQIYVDDTTGLTWYYINDSLYQYDERKQQYRSFPIGHMENYRGHVQIYPYGDEVIVMLDHRLERFDRHGEWLSTLAYPRSLPDDFYNWASQGENSVVIDEDTGVFYLVQGFRIIALDLENHTVHTVFRQNYGYINEPIVYGNQFYFLFHSSYTLIPSYFGGSSRAGLYTEVVRIDQPSEQITRYIVDGYYDVLELAADGVGNGLGDGEGGNGGEPEFVLRRYE